MADLAFTSAADLSSSASASRPTPVPSTHLQSQGSHSSHPNYGLHRLLVYLHYSYPIVLLIFFLLSFTARSILTSSNNNANQSSPTAAVGPGGKSLPGQAPARKDSETKHLIPRGQRLLFIWLSVVADLTFVGSAANVILHALVQRKEGWWCGESVVIYIVGAFFVYSLFIISLVDTKPAPTAAHLWTWTLAVVMEIVLLAASLRIYSGRHRVPQLHEPEDETWRSYVTSWEAMEVAIDTLRIIILIGLIAFYLLFITVKERKARKSRKVGCDETTSLLVGYAQNGHTETENGYGSTTAQAASRNKAKEAEQPAWVRPNTIPSRNWWEYLKGYSTFFPYLWPSKDRRLQLHVLLCFLIVVLQRVVNVLVPYQVGKITDQLSGEYGPIQMPWTSILLYIIFRLLQGSNGLLGAARSVLWISVGQYSYRELSVAAFEHVHSLSLDFHLGKRTGEVLSALGKGSAINTFLEQVTFQVLPMIFDLGVAIGFFLVVFDAYYALVVAVVTFWYLYLTVRLAQWRADIRRQMVNADRDQDAVKNDSMVSYETVKYFNAESYEFSRYRSAVEKYQTAEFKVLSSLSLLNVTQNLVFMLGMMIACFIAAWQVTNGQRRVGDFVTLLTYMAQLQAPLNFFGTFYRMIQSAMINSERMLELFKEQPTVVDRPDAVTMSKSDGDIRFSGVHFSYDARKPALSGVDFRCAPGSTTALVGESGGGKSTVFRLLFRFYNIQGGSIFVDDQDVRDVTVDSLRRQIGVVPQDTVLFNETVMYNLRYANPDATDEDVYRACQAASIHEKIKAFPDGYQTMVGERGLRLSGGEKQRVAIARTILKNPRIILLDEATAALDTETEEHIQEALQHLSRGRTMLVIAHRLSTITQADQIIVLHEGRVAESGTHEGLLAKKGRYAMMWKKQVKAQRAAEEAKALNDKADRLRRESKDGMTRNVGEGSSASHSEDERDGHQRHHSEHSSSGSSSLHGDMEGEAINRSRSRKEGSSADA